MVGCTIPKIIILPLNELNKTLLSMSTSLLNIGLHGKPNFTLRRLVLWRLRLLNLLNLIFIW
jgi:hypothetical protein